MCRNIRILRRADGPPTDEELHDAALQFVRKISGYRVPSKANEEVFEPAVHEVAAAGRRLFADLQIRPGPGPKPRAASRRRFAERPPAAR